MDSGLVSASRTMASVIPIIAKVMAIGMQSKCLLIYASIKSRGVKGVSMEIILKNLLKKMKRPTDFDRKDAEKLLGLFWESIESTTTYKESLDYLHEKYIEEMIAYEEAN